LKSIVALSVPFTPGKASPPALPQARAFWYQWFLCTHPGEEKFRNDPIAYGKAQWDTWGPANWYTQAEFEDAASSWRGKDFEGVVLHAYRHRWGHAELDSQYAKLQAKYMATETLNIPTLLLHGADDHCQLAETTDGAERHFTATYRRILLDGVGHFPQREAAERTAEQLLEHLGSAT
jgi:pimeloyl-ACP methyl ester carboxylesterase